MRTQWVLPEVSDAELLEVERTILRAVDTRDVSELNILGMGELGLAVGWPTESPHAVFKRQAPGPAEQLEVDRVLMHRFHDQLKSAGASVIPTDVRMITNDDGDLIPYLIQPLVERNKLAEVIIANDEPRPDHPVLMSIRTLVSSVVRDDPTGGLSIDAQVTNFAWNGSGVVSLDTTPPLIWDAASGPLYDVGNYLTAVPAVLRPVALRLTKRAGNGYRTVRGVLELTAAYLTRINQERWVDSAIECFNEILDEPLDRATVDHRYEEMLKDIPMIKRLARLQRFWSTHVRRTRYEFFITNSFTGEIY